MISDAAFRLIVEEEVSSEQVYTRRYRRPEWPGASSGATVGIGYDLGQTAPETIRADWRGRVSAAMLEAMVSASGYTGEMGRVATARVRHLIDIPWTTAIAVHRECVLPRWEKITRDALPNCHMLSGDSFGALVSLTFNRGPSYSRVGERYREMRAIRAHMQVERFGAIPAEIRSMRRLWPDLIGLQKRRDREAELFRRGLSATPMSEIPLPPDIPAPERLPEPVGATQGWLSWLVGLVIGLFRK